MNINDFKVKWCEFSSNLNKNGIPLPMFRDPDTGRASVSLSLLLISVSLVVIGIIGKYSKLFDGIDANQSLNFFYATSALYFGRKLSKSSTGTVTVEPPEKLSKSSGDQQQNG